MEIRLPHNTTYDFGIGVHRLSGTAMNKVVRGEISGVPYAAGSIQSFEVSRVRSSRDLQQQLGIDIDASYGCASFGAGIEARFNYMKESKIQSTCLFMTVNATIRYEDLSIDEPSLTETAGKMMDQPGIFEQRYGDMFIRACKRGGLFVGVLRVETSSEEESSSIEGELRGTYGLFSAEAKANWKEVINSSNATVYCSIYSEGGPTLQMRNPNDPLELLELANNWMKEMNEKPNQYARVYEWTLSPITIAEGPLPLNLVELEHGQDILKFCSRKRASLLDQLNTLDWIVSHPERFDWTNSASKEELLKAYNKTQVDLDTIADCASAATNHPRGAKFPVDYAAAHGRVFPEAIVPSPLPKPTPSVLSPGIISEWDSTVNDINIKLVLRRTGNQVTGIYYGYNDGIIEDGILTGNVLQGRWKESESISQGRFRFVFNDNRNSFSGTWGYGDREIEAGSTKWIGTLTSGQL